MSHEGFRVGIIGLQPNRSWASLAHLPALATMPETFTVAGVANTSRASAEAAAAACGLPRAFNTPEELISSPEIDVVTVTVKVPHHFELVRRAIESGKHVYCEWPLGRTLEEAEALARMANAKGVVCVVGTQARLAPEAQYLKHLIATDYVGEVLSSTLVGAVPTWGASMHSSGLYLLDRANGATMVTIPLGHTLAAVQEVLGPITDVAARLYIRRPRVTVSDTGGETQMTAHDQALVNATLQGGAPLSAHYRGGVTRGVGLLWTINGTEGDIEVTGANGHAQMVQLSLAGGREGDKNLQPLAVPEAYLAGAHASSIVRNVAAVYARMARDIRDGGRSAPTFDDAVALHRLLSAIETAGETGGRVTV